MITKEQALDSLKYISRYGDNSYFMLSCDEVREYIMQQEVKP